MQAKPNPNRWLVTWRKYHTWVGLAVAVGALSTSATGIYLNHEDGLWPGKPEKKGAGVLTPATFTAFAVTPGRAAEIAAVEWGPDAPLEKIELKDEKGTAVYKVKRADGAELVIAADAGTVTRKAGYAEGGGTNWGKVLKDLHTGQLAGPAGRFLTDLVAVGLIVLTLSGLYLWWVPLRRKKASAAARAAAAVGTSPRPALATAAAVR